MPTHFPTFSVIIPTRHRNDLLAKCLDCLRPSVQTLSADQYEVIVTDDGSDSTAEEMTQDHYPWVKWVAGPRKGPAANRNNGAKVAEGEWLVFTDDDCLPDAQWLAAYAEAITGTELALEGAIHPIGNLDQDLVECPVNLTGGCFWSANIAVQRILFKKVGGFDPNYSLAAHEDQDLKLRLECLTDISFISKAIVKHPVRSISLFQAIQRVPERCYTFAYYAKKNQEKLGYTSLITFASSQYKFHLHTLILHLLNVKICSSLITVINLLIGVPIVIYHFNWQESKD